ncbi:hypothetical protein RND81_09G205800 [Saponaria officinalis]|uniref:Uncharacterized protein n=1 Tax=Saponaria officinalis TaxID=3572 RepID=A0AAW1IQF0_SAPOF
MRRGSAYADTNPNPYASSQRQPISAQQNPVTNSYAGSGDAFRAEEERPYASAKSEEVWQWDRDAQQMSPHLYSDGQRGYTSKSFYSTPMPDVKLNTNQESRVLPQEQDMEVGYEDNPAPQTLDGLEQKFRDDIMKLSKELVDTENAENARHREKIIEIDNQYQEKISALRTRHATRREEFFRKESQSRLHQYQLAGAGTYPNNSAPADINHSNHGYGGMPGSIPGEPQRQYESGQYDTFRNPESLERRRMQGADTRVPTPGGGRVYNTGSRYY